MAAQQRHTFVGRQREMDTLTSALDDAATGRGQMVMLAGEPGIGKTRLAQELASRAESSGARVLWGWCYEREGAPPYWPWVQPISSYVLDAAPDRLRAELGPGAADVADLIPEIREKLPDLGPPPALDPEQTRFRLFNSISTFLKNLAQSQSLVLVLDDIHWADTPSLLLLEFLARQMVESRILVIGTYRDIEISRQHPLNESLVQLSRSQSFHRLVLGGLEPQDVGPFIQAAGGENPSSELINAIHTHTEGNPLFLSEVIRLLGDQDALGPSGRATVHLALGLPQGVLEVIGQRLNRLSADCVGVLTAAAVIGRQFGFNLLKNLSEEISEFRLLELVDEALDAHILQELPAQGDQYQFSHALVQQTLLETLSTSRKVRMHARIAEELETLYGEQPGEHAAELAYHFSEASPVTGPDKLVKYSGLAGERAVASYAYEDAIAHFERGLIARDIALSGTQTAPDEEAAALLFGLARAQSATVEGHQLAEAFAILSRAFEYYAEAGNVARAVAAAEFPIAPPAYLIPGVARVMARALTLVPADSHEAGRLLSRYGGTLGVAECDYEGAQQALEQAIAIARREGDVPLEVQTLIYAAVVSGIHLHWQESVDNGLRAIELATSDENPFSEFISRWWAAVGLLHMGNLDAARPHALVLRDLAERESTPRLHASVSLVPITSLACLEGNWKAAREYSGRGLELSPLNAHLLGPRVMLEHETGESAQREGYLDQLLEAMRGRTDPFSSGRTSMVITAVARTTGVPNRLEIAESAAKAALSEQSVTPGRAIFANAGLALLAVQKGDPSAAGEHYAYLLGQRGTMIWTVASVDRLLGLVSQTMGNLDQAAAHFAEAYAFCRKAGYRPELAWTCCDYADTLLERNTEGDRAKAISLLNESLALSSELGMRPLVERAAAIQERAEAQPVRKPAYPDGLTQREVEVIRLVATGKTDREIGGELIISINTVSNHVRNILGKTGAANRAEAASYAAHHGLTIGPE